MSKWTKVRLLDLAADEPSSISKPYGSAMVREDYVLSGIPVVRGVNLARGRFHDADFVFITAQLADRMPGARLQPGDLVFTHRGSVGQVSMIPRTPRYERYAVSTSQVKARLDPLRALPEFIYYWFQSPDGKQSILQGVSTVGVPGLAQPVATVKSLMVPTPPLATQRAIADVLGALDDKIAANARLIDVADQLSQASFQSVAMDSASLPLSATARFVNGKAFTKGASGTGRVVIRIAELNSGIGGSTVYSDAEVDSDSLAQSGDILFAWSGSLTLHRWFREDGIVNQHIFKVIPNGYPSWVMYELLRERLAYFKGVAADKATTMGHIQRRHLDELVKVPSRSSIERINGTMTALWERTLLAERENLTLAATRDALLPQLMSGALRIKDAEKAIEEVL